MRAAPQRSAPPSPRARLPTPIAAKAGPMPTNDGLWPNDNEHAPDRRKPMKKLDQEYPIEVSEMNPAPNLTPMEQSEKCWLRAPRLATTRCARRDRAYVPTKSGTKSKPF